MDMNFVIYALLGLVAVFFIRRMIRIRSLKHYDPSDVDALLQSRGNIVLLDVRTEAERKAGSIKGSIHIPLHVLHSRLHDLEKYKTREIVCYCRSGNRSSSAALMLRGNGFSVANLRGGMADWNFSHR